MPVYQQGDLISSVTSPSDSPQGVAVDSASSVWSVDISSDDIYKSTQDGTVQSSFSAPAAGPRGLGIDSNGCLWNADSGTATIYKLNQSGAVQSSFSSPSSDPGGVGVDSDGCLWNGDFFAGTLYKLDQSGSVQTSVDAPKSVAPGFGIEGTSILWGTSDTSDLLCEIAAVDLGLAPASNPTLSSTPDTSTASTSTTATAARPTATATPPLALGPGAVRARAIRPTATTATRGTGTTATTATASKPTTAASTRDPLSYASVPLLDGVPLGEDVTQIIRWDEIELEIRADTATLDNVLRPLQVNAGKHERLDHPSGGYETADPVATSPDNTFRYSPRYAEHPVVESGDVLPDSYVERPISKQHDAFRVTVTAKLDANPEPASGLVSESAGAKEWRFDTHAGTIATERVQRDTEAEASSGALGYVLRMYLSETQARALRSATGHLGAVGTSGGEKSNVDAVDNSPEKSNSLNLQPRDTNQIARGHYVVRSVEFDRMDPEGTWYETRVEIAPNTTPIVGASRPTVAVESAVAGATLGATGVASRPTVAVESVAASAETIPDSGVAYWNYKNENNDTTVLADAWNNNDGSVSGATYLSSGGDDGNGGFDFDGSNDYINVNTAIPTPSFSYWGILNPDDISSSSSREFFGSWDYYSGTKSALFRFDSGNLQFYVNENGTITSIEATAESAGTYRDVACVYDDTVPEIRMYENGTLLNSTSVGGGGVTSVSSFRVGGQASDSSDPIDGVMSEGKLYDKPLSDTEVSNLSSTGSI